ncbi:MAG: hypothetical protein ABSF28_16600 [Terracidiphilus sp.]|jgi:hypothetical protein
MPDSHVPLPGFAVAVVAGIAALMSVHPDLRPWQKFIYLLLIGAFIVIEFRAIRSDRLANDTAQAGIRDLENAKFDSIAKSLQDSIDLGKGQYASTIGHVDSVLQKTNAVASIAQANLNDVSGEGSHPCVRPDGLAMTGNLVPFEVSNQGKNILTGVEVSIHTMRQYQAARLTGGEHRIYVGTIPNEWPKFLPAIVPEIESDGMAHYFVEIWAQNGYYSGVINFRRAKGGQSDWAYQYWEGKQEWFKGPTKEFPMMKHGGGVTRPMKDCQQFTWSDGSKD